MDDAEESKQLGASRKSHRWMKDLLWLINMRPEIEECIEMCLLITTIKIKMYLRGIHSFIVIERADKLRRNHLLNGRSSTMMEVSLVYEAELKRIVSSETMKGFYLGAAQGLKRMQKYKLCSCQCNMLGAENITILWSFEGDYKVLKILINKSQLNSIGWERRFWICQVSMDPIKGY